ncbi:cytochrome c oxidase subunit II [Cognatilysobacter segetis]|uniref:cytochrome c oxidase subunit II n=1 Tax=Cognatilysobacter segetis TaxID=2492394 RepID=UPI00105E501F
MKAGRIKQWAAGLVALALPVLAFAQQHPGDPTSPHRWQLNMREGVTQISRNAYDAHMLALWICVGIGVLVFGAMAVAMVKFRKSKGAVADVDFTHSTKLEILWTVIPIVLLVAMAFPATSKLINMYDVRQSAMTIKVTGYQWMWKYDYLGQGVSLTSRLKRESDDLRQSGKVPTLAESPNYLLEVDNELVVPVGTKIRFVVTADDVIHAWWVPSLGWKQDAIPGLVNEAWAKIDRPGVYRGQCAELCGKDHGFMPIVVRAVPMAEFQQWMAAHQAAPAAAPTPAAPAGTNPTAPAANAQPTTAAAPNSDAPTAPVAG